MTWRNLSVLAVVPARGGSKDIPGKNLRRVGGLSLVARAARFIQLLPWLDAAVLSTEDDAIASEGEAYGLRVPFRRPAELAGDDAASVDVWRHAWRKCERLDGCRYDISILLEPTSPLRRVEDIGRTVEAMVKGGHKAAATVSRAPGHFTPEKCLTIDDTGHIRFYHPEGARYSRRQVVSPYYFRNGICYAVTREALLDAGHILEDKCTAVVIDRPVINIDDPFDLELAEFLLAREELA